MSIRCGALDVFCYSTIFLSILEDIEEGRSVQVALVHLYKYQWYNFLILVP